MKDDLNAGSLYFRQGKVEFKNVFFSYTNGWVVVDICETLNDFQLKRHWTCIYTILLLHSTEILRDISFTVLPGQTVALVCLENLVIGFLNYSFKRNLICLVPNNCTGGTIRLWEKHHHSTHLPVLWRSWRLHYHRWPGYIKSKCLLTLLSCIIS